MRILREIWMTTRKMLWFDQKCNQDTVEYLRKRNGECDSFIFSVRQIQKDLNLRTRNFYGKGTATYGGEKNMHILLFLI